MPRQTPRSRHAQFAIACLGVLFVVPIKTHANDPSDSDRRSHSLAAIKKAGPLCTPRIVIAGRAKEERTKLTIRILERLDGLDEHESKWFDVVERLMKSDKATGSELMYFLGKMGLLFDDAGKLRTNLSATLLNRWKSIPQGESDAWFAAFHKIAADKDLQKSFSIGGGAFYGMSLREPADMLHIEIMLTLLATDAVYKDDKYDIGQAKLYRQRVASLTPKDIQALITAIPEFKYAETDAAISLALCAHLFDKGTLNQDRFTSSVKKLGEK